MSVHIAVGKQTWCRMCFDLGIRQAADELQIPTTCEHPSGATAVALVHLLQDFGLDARIVDGMCEWNPAQQDFRKLRRNK